MTYDYIVIGAGISGLASAIILSKNGLKTALIEKSNKTGPLLRGFKRKGYYFDTGFHHAGGIGTGSSGQVMLNYLGVLKHLAIIPSNPECFDVVRTLNPSFEFQFPVGYERITEGLHEVFPYNKQAIDEYINEIKKQCSFLPFLNLDADPNSYNILENVHSISLDKFMSNLTGNESLKAIISIHCLLNGVPPHEQAMNNYAYIVGPYYESVSYFQGGGSKIITELERAAKENGVDIFTNKDATELIFSPAGDLNGIAFQDESVMECKGCISTIHPLQLLRITPDSLFRPSYIKRIKSLEETHSAYILYGTSEIDLNTVFGSNLYVLPAARVAFSDYSKPLEERPINIVSTDLGKSGNPSREGFIAICPASIKETEQWEDSITGDRPSGYILFKEEIKERILRYIESSCPEMKGKIRAVDCSTPLTLRDYTGSPFGSMYGVKHRRDQYNPMPITRVPNLFLAGQSIVAPGLLGSIISAFLACGSILGKDFIRGELKKWV